MLRILDELTAATCELHGWTQRVRLSKLTGHSLLGLRSIVRVIEEESTRLGRAIDEEMSHRVRVHCPHEGTGLIGGDDGTAEPH